MNINKLVISISTYLLIAILGVTDFITGYEISFSIFYFIPVLIATWFLSRSSAVLIAIFCAVVWYFADVYSGHLYSNFLIPAWNAMMRLGVFICVAYFAGSFKKELEAGKILSRTDSLTGAFNARYFNELVAVEVGRAVRFNRPVTIAYIDVDNFKRVNDKFGHSEGDDLLCLVARTIKQSIRGYDILARVGGDEFVILFPETSQEKAAAAVEKVKGRLTKAVRKYTKLISFSIGVVTYNKLAYDVNEMIKKADASMYSVKRKGKDSIKYSVVD